LYQVTNNFRHFWNRVGILRSLLRFAELDIEPSSVTGAFDPQRVAEMTQFCRKHPEYHIVSLIRDGSYLNGFSANGSSYYLANGDRNPNLAFNPRGYIDTHDLSV